MSLIKLKCAFCEKEFFRRKGRFNEAKKLNWRQYCSRKCLSKDRSKKQLLVCENCGKSFMRPQSAVSSHNYCSRSCATKVNNKKVPKRKAKSKICLRCGRQFLKSTGNLKYCSVRCKREAERKYTSQQLINIIKRTSRAINRVPTKRELKEISDICVKSFGSWNNAVLAAGLTPNRSHDNRMYKRTNAKSLDGHVCDSVSELLIDNWLYKNNILHEKNIQYPKTHHKADWKISAGKREIFVEYFGLANDSPRYDRSIKEKERLCKKHNISLIGIYPKDLYPKKYLESNLKNKLKDFIGN